jgi:hypothetical protein
MAVQARATLLPERDHRRVIDDLGARSRRTRRAM